MSVRVKAKAARDLGGIWEREHTRRLRRIGSSDMAKAVGYEPATDWYINSVGCRHSPMVITLNPSGHVN